jgi:hypothetical protein
MNAVDRNFEHLRGLVLVIEAVAHLFGLGGVRRTNIGDG